MFPCALLCDQVKFKWRIVEAWNVEPRTAPATLDSRFGGLLHLPHSPLLQLHPLAASSTSSDFASIPHIPFSHPSTLPPLQPPCLLHFASTPYLPLSHPSTLPTLQPPCLLHFASTPYYIPLSHPSIHPLLAPLQSPCLLHFASSPYLPLSHPSTLAPLQSPCLVHFASAPYITSSIHPHLPLVRHHGRLVRRPPLRPRRGAGREVRVERRVVEVFAATAEVHHYCAPRQKESQSPLFAAAPPPPQPPPPKGSCPKAVPLSPHHPFEKLGNSFLYESG